MHGLQEVVAQLVISFVNRQVQLVKAAQKIPKTLNKIYTYR
jgi:hypothetical protein